MPTEKEPGYMLLDGETEGIYCQLDFLENFEDTYKLYKGWPLVGEWPANATFRMDPTLKKQIKLSDHILNPNHSIVASKRLQDFMLSEKVPNIELLPVKILDHKKRVASSDYAIVHLVTTQDCIDGNKSNVTWNNINPEQILKMDKLVIDEKKIDPKAVVFRAKGLVNQIFVRRDFASKLVKGKFTGLEFWELTAYR